MKLKGVFLYMYLYHNIENDHNINVEEIFARQQIIQKIKQRFSTYGYNEISTSAFESYDLYAKMNGTVNHHEMIKTIDNTGKVLVLRPDITIPITQQIARNTTALEKDLRYFYVLDVFRQTAETKEYRESTQAGVEYFGNPHAEADAEIIALAIHLLQDLKVSNFKIELGHAGFFKQLVTEMNLDEQDLQELKRNIQAKNITEIEQSLTQLSVNSEMKEIVTSLPFLYGSPQDVIKRAKKLPLTTEMIQTLTNLQNIYQVLESYGVEKHVVIDLSLINHMDYYSDIIFQGFIEKVGKPILMGGRYNTLANQFNADLPAIGFACDVDFLISGLREEILPKMNQLNIILLFEKSTEKVGLQLANLLRNKKYHVLTYPITTNRNRIPKSQVTISIKKGQQLLIFGNKQYPFTTEQEVITLLQQIRERK